MTQLEQINQEKELQRRKLWCEVYVASVSDTINGYTNEQRLECADFALSEFDKRFMSKIEIVE